MEEDFEKWVCENFNKLGHMYIQKNDVLPTMISYINKKDLRDLWEKFINK